MIRRKLYNQIVRQNTKVRQLSAISLRSLLFTKGEYIYGTLTNYEGQTLTHLVFLRLNESQLLVQYSLLVVARTSDRLAHLRPSLVHSLRYLLERRIQTCQALPCRLLQSGHLTVHGVLCLCQLHMKIKELCN